MSQEKKYDIFISYSRKDFDEVKAFVDMLKKRIPKLEVWMDLEGIEAADEFDEKIISAIDASSYVIFAMSKNSNSVGDGSSKWTKKELVYAENTGKKVIPLTLKGGKLNSWFLFEFGRVDTIDSTNHLEVEKLLTNISKWTGKELAAQKKETRPPIIFTDRYDPVLHIFFLIDCSGSMLGRRMDEVNYACSEVLRDLQIINPDVEIKINVLCFDSDVHWIYETPVSIDEFSWTNLNGGGQTNFGGACIELNQKMNRANFFAPCVDSGRSYWPSLIILMTDGEPTDDYTAPLQELQNNGHFRSSKRFAFGFGDEINRSILEQFAGKKKVFIIPDEEEKLGLKPMLERILHMGLYAGSYAMLEEDYDEEEN